MKTQIHHFLITLLNFDIILLGYICLFYLYNGNTIHLFPTFHVNHLSSLKLAMVAVRIYTMEISKH